MPQMTFPDINSVLPRPDAMGGSLQGGNIVQAANQTMSAFTSGFASFVNSFAAGVPAPPLPQVASPLPFPGVASSDRSSDRMVPANYSEQPVYM
jgi:hypothetical protein